MLSMFEKQKPSILFNLTYLAVTALAYATTAPAKTQVNRSLASWKLSWLQ